MRNQNERTRSIFLFWKFFRHNFFYRIILRFLTIFLGKINSIIVSQNVAKNFRVSLILEFWENTFFLEFCQNHQMRRTNGRIR